jgi:hypothetical protein
MRRNLHSPGLQWPRSAEFAGSDAMAPLLNHLPHGRLHCEDVHISQGGQGNCLVVATRYRNEKSYRRGSELGVERGESTSGNDEGRRADSAVVAIARRRERLGFGSLLFALGSFSYRSTRRLVIVKLPAVPGAVLVVSTTNSSVSASAGSKDGPEPTGVISSNRTMMSRDSESR